MNNAYILSAQRTPIGSFQGQFADTPAPRLGAVAIQAAIEKAGVQNEDIDEVIFGQVLTAGAGQAPARQAAIYAGIPTSAVCMTINKVCGSGLKTVMLANDSIRLGESQVVVAGGQENMTLAPHLLEKSRGGYRMGHTVATDSMIKDGLWDPYNDFHMGMAAELCVKEHNFTREQQDQFAKESYEWAIKAQDSGAFNNEMTPVEVKSRKNTLSISKDEEPQKVKFDKMPGLRPAFDKEGSITAANASKINDGAAALVLASEDFVKLKGLQPMARIVGQASFAQDPKWFTTAPVGAMKKVSEKTGIKMQDIDLFEINEAFAVVTMAAMKELSIPREKVNVHGGAVALGHPIGGSGARIFTTLLHALKTHNKKYGMASICIGGGEAVAVIVENL
jgi:acetyl-CoA C-acetyltransferase